MTEASAAVATDRMSTPWGIPGVLGAFLVAAIVVILGQGTFASFTRDLEEHHHLLWEIAAYQFLAFGVLIAASAVVLIPHHVGPIALGYRFPGWPVIGASVASVILILFGAYGVEELFNALFPSFHVHGNAAQLVPGHPHLSTAEKIALVVWAVVEAPFTEETLFRGVMFQGIRESLSRRLPYQVGVFVAALITGVLFGLVHGEPHTLPILAFLGIALAYIFQFGRSIYASVVVHASINALAVVSLLHST